MPLGLGLQSRRAEICRLYVLVVEETRRIAVIDDGAVLQDIAMMGDAECHMGVLLHRGEPIEGSSRSSILGPCMRARGGGYGSAKLLSALCQQSSVVSMPRSILGR